MSIEKKLGVFGVDEIIREDGRIHALDYYCVRCYDVKKDVQAEKFWPNVDVDIKSFPYCKPCIDYLNLELIISFE